MSAGESNVRVITVATRREDPSGKGGHLCFLESSCRACGLDLEVLGLGLEWGGFGMKLRLVADHVAGLRDDALVLFADAYDVILVGGIHALVERFLRFDSPIVFSAEAFCWPREDLAPLHPLPGAPGAQRVESRLRRNRPSPPLNVPARYLNSGAYMGRAGAIRSAIREVAPRAEDDDQELFTLYFLAHPEVVALDYGSALFLSLCGVGAEDVEVGPGSPPRVVYRWTGAAPCVLHGNGWGMKTLVEVRRRLEALGWPGAAG